MNDPKHPAELRETLRGWPLPDLRKAIRAALPAQTSVTFKKAPMAKGKAHKNGALSFRETEPE